MRRLVWISVLAFTLAVPAVGFALSSDNDGTLSVKAGVGRVYLNFNGSVVGRLQRGFIQVSDLVASDGVGFEFSGCDVERDKSDTTANPYDTVKICRGDNLRFRAIGGKYQVLIRGARPYTPGSGIYLSAVGHGFAVLNGAGDDPAVDSDGTYSLNDGPYRSLPDLDRTLTLAAPSAP
jgi:hypothetical protein